MDHNVVLLTVVVVDKVLLKVPENDVEKAKNTTTGPCQ